MKIVSHCIFIILMCLTVCQPSPAQTSDSERLGMALDYYCSEKYHEALIIFERLDQQYALNPRYHAYMGVCYYHEQIYDLACRYFDDAIPQLGVFSPIERFSYYYLAAECHFILEEYKAALPYYEQALTVCPAQRRVEVLSRLEWCRKVTTPEAPEEETDNAVQPIQEPDAKAP